MNQVGIGKYLLIIVEAGIVVILVFVNYSKLIRPELLFHRQIKSGQWLNSRNKFKNQSLAKETIIFVGNSLTYGFDLSAFNNSKIVNWGIGGDFTGTALLRLDEIVAAEPSKVFLEIGINDILANYSSAEIMANYNQIVAFIREKSPETKIVIQSIIPVLLKNTFYVSDENANNKIIEINAFLKELCSEQNLLFVNLYDHFVFRGSLNPEFTTDGVHLNRKGYDIWKHAIIELI